MIDDALTLLQVELGVSGARSRWYNLHKVEDTDGSMVTHVGCQKVGLHEK